jgi:hypothetical protein
MNKKIIIASLIECANDLDDQGLIDDADEITRIAQLIGNFPDEDPNAYKQDMFEANDANYEDEQALLEQLLNSDVSPPDDLEPDIEDDGNTGGDEIRIFEDALKSAGANVEDPFTNE